MRRLLDEIHGNNSLLPLGAKYSLWELFGMYMCMCMCICVNVYIYIDIQYSVHRNINSGVVCCHLLQTFAKGSPGIILTVSTRFPVHREAFN